MTDNARRGCLLHRWAIDAPPEPRDGQGYRTSPFVAPNVPRTGGPPLSGDAPVKRSASPSSYKLTVGRAALPVATSSRAMGTDRKLSAWVLRLLIKSPPLIPIVQTSPARVA